MKVNKSFFQIGIYNPEMDNCWPWHFHYENGRYLSAKKRICSWNRPAEFETEKEAREFYHSWKQKDKYKMELIKIQKWVEIPDPVFPKDHPYSILKKIIANEKSRFITVASLWFSGIHTIKSYSRPTQIKYRNTLLKYGIDLFSDPTKEIKAKWQESHYSNFCDFEFKENPKLKVVS